MNGTREPVFGKAIAMKESTKSRILMLLENLPYPQDVRVRREATALVAAGYSVSVICPLDAGQLSRDIVNGVRVYRYAAPPSANGFLGYLWEYGYSMAASFVLSLMVFFHEGFDVVHAHNPPDTFVFIAAFYKLFGKRFVYDHHDLSPEMYQARFPGGGNRLVYHALVLLEKLSCSLADHVIVTNESYKKVAMERGRVPESRTTIVRNGIELHRLRQPVEPDRALRQMGKIIVGYVGVMGLQDGVDYLLRALHHLVHSLGRTDFYCILIGGGDAWEGLTALARKLDLGNYVLFTGPVFGQGLLSYLSATDICVDAAPSNPYSDRSTMFKVMEYMSLTKPVVAFDLHEHRFTARQAAVYVPNNDERAFAQAIAELMDDPQRRKILGEFGRCRIEKELAWDFSIPNLLDAYRTVLAAPRASDQPIPANAGAGMLPQSLPLARTTTTNPESRSESCAGRAVVGVLFKCADDENACLKGEKSP
jgi:glycosyltransferase involved in cell wall biosynthesis